MSDQSTDPNAPAIDSDVYSDIFGTSAIAMVDRVLAGKGD